MSALTSLIPELRYSILDYVIISATAPIEPPNVDEADPEEWGECKLFEHPGYLQAEAPAYLQRAQRPTSRLIPYLLVSTAFQQDIQHVWTQYVAPKQYPVLCISFVGADRDRPMKGTLLTWLSPLPTFPNVSRVEWVFRFYDQKSNKTGHSSLKRSYEHAGQSFDLTLMSVLEKSILRDWFVLQPHFPKGSGSFGYWVFRLSTEADPDVHFASSEYYDVQDPHLKIMPHPYREVGNLKEFLKDYIEFDLLTGCEIWIDDTLVCRLTPRRKDEFVGMEFGPPDHAVPKDGINQVDCEEFDYVLPVDPLLVLRSYPDQVPSGPY